MPSEHMEMLWQSELLEWEFRAPQLS